MFENENDLVLRPAPVRWYRIGENESENERERQREFSFMDETPPTKVFSFMLEKGKP